MRAQIHLDPASAALAVAGRPLAEQLLRVVSAAGFDVVEDAGDALALHVDGRFAAVLPGSLARLEADGDALLALDGTPIAAIGHGRTDLDRADGPRASTDESFDASTPAGRVRAERVIRRRHAEDLLDAGVIVVDPDRVTLDTTVEVAAGATLWPDVVLRGHTRVGAGAEVRIGCWIEDSEIGEDALIKPHSVCEGASVGAGSQVGPMAHLRPGARLEGDNKVGNFVEVKKAVLHRGAKASHLTYLGDAEIGADANIGAGTITCNYDGHRKHRTRIGAGAFIGSNSALVAPISVGDGAIVGAGSTLTRDVPADALAVVRGQTKVLEGKGKALNERNARLKAQEQAKG